MPKVAALPHAKLRALRCLLLAALLLHTSRCVRAMFSLDGLDYTVTAHNTPLNTSQVDVVDAPHGRTGARQRWRWFTQQGELTDDRGWRTSRGTSFVDPAHFVRWFARVMVATEDAREWRALNREFIEALRANPDPRHSLVSSDERTRWFDLLERETDRKADRLLCALRARNLTLRGGPRSRADCSALGFNLEAMLAA